MATDGATIQVRIHELRQLYGVWPVVRERRWLERLAAADVRLSTAPSH